MIKETLHKHVRRVHAVLLREGSGVATLPPQQGYVLFPIASAAGNCLPHEQMIDTGWVEPYLF